jgi:hypothetical protein
MLYKSHFEAVLIVVCMNTVTQSICTHYSNFEKMGGFATLKKSGTKYGVQKTGCKKTGSGLFFAIQKEKRLAFSFLNCKL